MGNDMKRLNFLLVLLISMGQFLPGAFSQSNDTRHVLEVDLSDYKVVTPVKYGWHYEEIGMIGDGGIHAEMVRNRGFEEANMPPGLVVEGNTYADIPQDSRNPRKRVYEIDPLIGWEVYPANSPQIDLSRVDIHPLNQYNPHSLCLMVKSMGAAVVNKGYFGMFFEEGKRYNLSFYCRSEAFNGSVDVFLGDNNGEKVSEVFVAQAPGSTWEKYEVQFKATATTKSGMLCFKPGSEGRIYLDMVSLFPDDTWDNGRSVFRKDIMENLVDYAPDFLRFPGGCIVHGVNIETMYYWKNTIGDIAERPGAWSKWSPNYRTDGIGYHEFYELCEYLGSEAMYVTPSGLVCTEWLFASDEKDEHEHPEVNLNIYIQDVLDAIEYAIGPVDSYWGSKRAENGHPAPFPLKYISIGNEDFGPTYYQHYHKFYHVIKSKYPQLKIIANSIIGQSKDSDRKRERIKDFLDPSTVKIFDEHYYRDIPWVIDNHFKFDGYTRPGPDLFIGELGIRGEHPLDVLGEAVFMMSVERNADLDPMIADRPLARNWDYVKGQGNPLYFHTNSLSFKTYNYYMSKLFRDNKIDAVYNSRYGMDGKEINPGISYLFSSAGRDKETGEFILKVVNLSDQNIVAELQIDGLPTLVKARVTTLDSDGGNNNSPTQPGRVLPEVKNIDFNLEEKYDFKPRTFTVFRMKGS